MAETIAGGVDKRRPQPLRYIDGRVYKDTAPAVTRQRNETAANDDRAAQAKSDAALGRRSSKAAAAHRSRRRGSR